ncbi:tandem C2 domains nuclear protein [Corythoichthys intestinalis]|uniref:tandem C2 domains nuclear protein n=1 Tax=Corythoichthys intestinalis TaxID=161448 RepID=UPI0025A5D7DD|nr:tandem C2 domains nuclear protein [Corythoichthys intestinalis]
MECIKNCCKRFSKKRGKETDETEDIAVQIAPSRPAPSNIDGINKDYLLSKMPTDGKEVPFVLPTLKALYVQPGATNSHNLRCVHGPARCTYAQRKAELLAAATPLAYSCESNLHAVTAGTESISANLNPRDNERYKNSSESFSVSGDDLGRLCVRLNYQEEKEQVWITLVQCSQLNLPVNIAQKPTIRIKGIIKLPKAIHFKTSVKEYCKDANFMETFVFALSLQTLCRSALLLKLQTRGAKTRTVAECVLSLRGLGPQETEEWLRLRNPGAALGGGCKLHLATCFQPICRRMQVRVLAAQDLQTSSSSLPREFAVTVEMRGAECPASKEKTPALKAIEGQCQWDATFYFDLGSLHPASCQLSIKLFSRSSIKKKRCVGQVQLGFDVPTPEAAEQWKDTIDHPEKVVAVWHAVT